MIPGNYAYHRARHTRPRGGSGGVRALLRCLTGWSRECVLLLVGEASRPGPQRRAPPRPSRRWGPRRAVFVSACVSVLAPAEINKTGILLSRVANKIAVLFTSAYPGGVPAAWRRLALSHAAPLAVPSPVRRGRLSALAWRVLAPSTYAPQGGCCWNCSAPSCGSLNTTGLTGGITTTVRPSIS